MRVYTIIIIVIFNLLSLNAQIGFEERIIFSNEGSVYFPTNISYADIDGDGDQDIISSSYKDDKIAWFPNLDGNGTFGEIRIISQRAKRANDIQTGDIDGDGDIDVISASFGNNKIAWFPNLDGNGTFGEEQIVPNLEYESGALHLADIDGDGDLDLLTSSTSGGKFYWHKNIDGKGTFGIAILILHDGWNPHDIISADIDGDGNLDVVLSVNVKTYWCRNVDGQGNFSNPILISDTENHSAENIAVDLDGDGDLDIASTIFSDSKVIWYENIDGAGSSWNKLIIDTNNFGFGNVEAVDVDNDGDVDILATSRDSDLVAWYKNNGTGIFESRIVISENEDGVSDIKSTDFDGDGDLDLAVAAQYASTISWYENIDGFGNFIKKQVLTDPVQDIKLLTRTDIENDGDIDLIYMINNQLFMQENIDGNGTYNSAIKIAEFAVLQNVIDIKSIDIDKDGYFDLLINISSYKVVWLENIDGTGTYASPKDLLSGFINLNVIEVGDVDGDGYSDILTTSLNSDKIQYHRYIDSTKSYDPYISVTKFGNENIDLLISDIDMDGHNDIVSISKSNTIKWYPNLDSLGFGPPNKIDYSSNYASKIVAGDIDGDNDIDIISSSSEAIWIYINEDGIGTFSNKKKLDPQSFGSRGLSIADLDRDGDLDIVPSAIEGNKLIWYENLNGDGIFDRRQIDGFLIDTEQVMIYDVNKDMALDIVALTSDSKLVWYKNKGLNINKIVGFVRIDTHGDNCFSSNTTIPNLTVTANNGNESLATLSLDGKPYNIYAPEGTYDVRLTSELPAEWSVSPEVEQTTFDSLGIIDTINFCLINNTPIQDLNIVMTALGDARPGSIVKYQIIINNQGSAIVDGKASISFDKNKLNFNQSSNDIIQSDSSTLSLSFLALKPFESRAYELIFKLESIPTVNLSDILNFFLLIDNNDDDYPENNSFEFNQLIIGSYDPNDIQVAEGAEILLEQKTNYLHYTIRFQNTGTASAINIKVDNILDDNLDWNTFELLNTSHPVITNITDQNTITFSFNYIYLPDSLSNAEESQGYFTYRIKPLPTVDIGTQFHNDAQIYFDSNPPIQTNIVTTTIVEPNGTSNEIVNSDMFYPNPTTNSLISKVSSNAMLYIWSINGRLKWSGTLRKVTDISHLPNGTYIANIVYQNGRNKSQLIFKQ